MPITNVRGTQIADGSVQRTDLDVATAGNAVIRKVIAGTNVTISSTGVDAGTGDVTINATAGSVPSGTAVLDFSTNNIAIVTVTGATWVTTTSKIDVFISANATASHSEDEHMMLASFISFAVPVSQIVAATSFQIVGMVEDKSKLLGTINVNWTAS